MWHLFQDSLLTLWILFFFLGKSWTEEPSIRRNVYCICDWSIGQIMGGKTMLFVTKENCFCGYLDFNFPTYCKSQNYRYYLCFCIQASTVQLVLFLLNEENMSLELGVKEFKSISDWFISFQHWRCRKVKKYFFILNVINQISSELFSTSTFGTWFSETI